MLIKKEDIHSTIVETKIVERERPLFLFICFFVVSTNLLFPIFFTFFII